MNKGIFITGTDTGVGKTYIAVRIAEELRRRRVDVGVMKPAETGCRRRNGKLYPADAARLLKAAGAHDRLDDVNPYRYSRPLAPLVAAGFAEEKIDPNSILKSFGKLSRKHEFMIVEGAGGIMVPLCEKYSYLDLAGCCGLPVVVVACPGLGTINHTLLTLAALKQRQLNMLGVIINYADGRKTGLAEKTNPGIIEKISGVEVLGIVPYLSRNIERIMDKVQRVRLTR